MTSASTTTYALLGMLGVRPWTGYELTRQTRRSLRFVWPLSEGHLYREQSRLVTLGWARVEEEAAGRRTRKHYAITEAGRDALASWLASPPQEPHFQVEGVVRTFFGNLGTVDDLSKSLHASAGASHEMLAEMLGFVEEYLAAGGPVEMLEGTAERGEFHGRPMFPDRLHAVALAIDATTRLLGSLEEFFSAAAAEVDTWTNPEDRDLTPATRARLEAVLRRHRP